jgi:hypothetical protein
MPNVFKKLKNVGKNMEKEDNRFCSKNVKEASVLDYNGQKVKQAEFQQQILFKKNYIFFPRNKIGSDRQLKLSVYVFSKATTSSLRNLSFFVSTPLVTRYTNL